MNPARSVRLFLVEGDPTGIMTAEIINWTGQLATAPRARLAGLLARAELQKTGVYMLHGDNPTQSGERMLYVGEGDAIGQRIADHESDASKDFFEQVCVIVSKDLNLTKAHVRFLESEIVKRARLAGRAKLVNRTAPNGGTLPEADQADMLTFLANVELLLPILGIDALRPTTFSGVAAPNGDVFVYKTTVFMARMTIRGGEYVVLSGSTGPSSPVASFGASNAEKRSKLVADGVLAPTPGGKLLMFTRDVPFPSPSAAASMVYGGASSGLEYWKHELTGRTLRDFQADQSKLAVTAVAAGQATEPS